MFRFNVVVDAVQNLYPLADTKIIHQSARVFRFQLKITFSLSICESCCIHHKQQARASAIELIDLNLYFFSFTSRRAKSTEDGSLYVRFVDRRLCTTARQLTISLTGRCKKYRR